MSSMNFIALTNDNNVFHTLSNIILRDKKIYNSLNEKYKQVLDKLR